MSRSTIAVLFSAFLFPGAGHIYLKKYLAGGLLIVAALAALVYFTALILEKAFRVSEQIMLGQLSPDFTTLMEQAEKIAAADSQPLVLTTYAFLACWIIGIVDAYRVGKCAHK